MASPAKKRARLSSNGGHSVEEAKARRLNAIAAALAPPSSTISSLPLENPAPTQTDQGKLKRAREIEDALRASQTSSSTDVESTVDMAMTVASTSALNQPLSTIPQKFPSLSHPRSRSPTPPPPDEEADFSAWFAPPDPSTAALLEPTAPLFSTAKGTTWTVPPKEKIESAKRKLEEWSAEFDDPPPPIKTAEYKGKGKEREREPLTVLRQSENLERPSPTPFQTPTQIKRPVAPGFQKSSVLTGGRRLSFSSTPVARALGGSKFVGSPLAKNTRGTSGFVTPFKGGVRPTQMSLTEQQVKTQKQKEETMRNGKLKEAEMWKKRSVFDLTVPAGVVRKPLRDYGITPGEFTVNDLENLAIPTDLASITLSNAAFYSFNNPSPSPTFPSKFLGPSAALSYLQSKNCSHGDEKWTNDYVTNHWCMILWKLAGEICSSPGSALFAEVWNFEGVCRQLLYRYEREINRAQRPPVRLIQERDSPSTRPLILLVSEIHWTEDEETGKRGVECVELTDGWYKIMGKVDDPLTKACLGGKIVIGSKIAMAGIKLVPVTSQPAEVLYALPTTNLILTGNATSLAKWDAKLGFQPRPFIATLRSLTSDGGAVPALDVIVEKLFPLGYLEYFEGEDGGKGRTEGPRCEAEEMGLDEAWKRKRLNEEGKLREVMEKRWTQLEGIADRLERLAGGFMPPSDECPPDRIEDLFDELEGSPDHNVYIKSLSGKHRDCGLLSLFIRKKCELEKEKAGDEVEKELKSICPPRQVRNFRVVKVRDSVTIRRRAQLKAQLTVWDVLELGDNAIVEGGRYLVTSLIPSQLGAWMKHNMEGEIFLNTRRDSRWKKLGSGYS